MSPTGHTQAECGNVGETLCPRLLSPTHSRLLCGRRDEGPTKEPAERGGK